MYIAYLLTHTRNVFASGSETLLRNLIGASAVDRKVLATRKDVVTTYMFPIVTKEFICEAPIIWMYVVRQARLVYVITMPRCVPNRIFKSSNSGSLKQSTYFTQYTYIGENVRAENICISLCISYETKEWYLMSLLSKFGEYFAKNVDILCNIYINWMKWYPKTTGYKTIFKFCFEDILITRIRH